MTPANGGSPVNDLASSYPDAPGHRGVDTSIEAAEDLAPHVGRIQRMVRDAITSAGNDGLTSEECSALLGLDRGTVQPRTTELKLLGYIRPSGTKRFNRTGKRARVWVAVPEAERTAEADHAHKHRAQDCPADRPRPAEPSATHAA